MQDITSILVPESSVLDLSHLDTLDVNSPDFKSYLMQLTQNVNSTLYALNNKNSIVRDTKVVTFAALPNAAGTAEATHGLIIKSGYRFINIYGAATDTTNGDYLPIPYATTTALDIIELKVDNTKVYITVGKDMHTFSAIVVLEYLTY